jgi:hypothetical protein
MIYDKSYKSDKSDNSARAAKRDEKQRGITAQAFKHDHGARRKCPPSRA